MSGLVASVTLHVVVTDEQELWDAALAEHLKLNVGAFQTVEQAKEDSIVVEMIGTRDEPDVGGCLRMIYDPGPVSEAGHHIEDSSAEIFPNLNLFVE